MAVSTRMFNKETWGLLALEAVIVVLSVLLALGLDSWQKGRENDELARRAVQGVVDEARINCARIRQHHPYHQSVASGERPPQGIHISLLRNDAWDSAKSTGAAVYVDYDLASLIGSIHAAQGDHRTLVQSYMDALFMQVAASEQLKEIHGPLDVAVITEMIRIQERLLSLYQQLHDNVDEQHIESIGDGEFCMNPS